MPDIKIDVEYSVWGSDELLPLLYLKYENFEGETFPGKAYDMGVRIIFVWQGHVVNALMFGVLDQAGAFVLEDFSAEVSVTDATMVRDESALVTCAVNLFLAYVAAHDDPETPLESHDSLGLDDLFIDYPHNVG